MKEQSLYSNSSSSPHRSEEGKKIAGFIKKYGIACGGNWTAMLMTTIKHGLPKTYEAMDDNKEFTYEELYKILAENVS